MTWRGGGGVEGKAGSLYRVFLYISTIQPRPTQKMGPFHKENTAEENNGYIFLKSNIHGSAGKYSGITPPGPSHFLQQSSGLQDDVSGFPSISDIFFMGPIICVLSIEEKYYFCFTFYVTLILVRFCPVHSLLLFYSNRGVFHRAVCIVVTEKYLIYICILKNASIQFSHIPHLQQSQIY
jgi:hypothetical protein